MEAEISAIACENLAREQFVKFETRSNALIASIPKLAEDFREIKSKLHESSKQAHEEFLRLKTEQIDAIRNQAVAETEIMTMSREIHDHRKTQNAKLAAKDVELAAA